MYGGVVLRLVIQPTEKPKTAFQAVSFPNPFVTNQKSLNMNLWYLNYETLSLYRRVLLAFAANGNSISRADSSTSYPDKLPEVAFNKICFISRLLDCEKDLPGVCALIRESKDVLDAGLNLRDSRSGDAFKLSERKGYQKWIGSGSTEPSALKNKFSPKHHLK